MTEAFSENLGLSGSHVKDRQKKIYSVSELNRKARILLESEFRTVWVQGEVSNFKHHSSGHMYFTLKDEKSQLSSAFFSQNNRSLRFKMKDGLEVTVLGRISLYEARGQYQLIAERVEPKGIGSLQLAFLQMKAKLEKEGLFREEHKKEIPRFPKCIGVITSPTGAAIRDILNVVNRRFFGTAILLNPVSVQGDTAKDEIVRAIGEMNDYGDIDVLIVGRGGGSLEDLCAFNEEVVARAVFDSRIPVISAVGHEIDWTICDMVADLRAPTPSAAAELVVQNREELEIRLRELQVRMRHATLNLLKGWRENLEALCESYAFKQPQALVQQFSQRLDELLRQLQNYSKAIVVGKKQSFQAVIGRLHALSPLNILERGYTLTLQENGKLIKDARVLKVGDRIRTRLHLGILHSQVEKIESVGEEKKAKSKGDT